MSHEEPILILHTGRTGSSLTAGIFARHGCWTGHCHGGDRRNPTGYYENVEIHKDTRARINKNLTQMARPFENGVWKKRRRGLAALA